MLEKPEQEALQIVLTAAKMVKDKKSLDTVLISVGKVTFLADYFLLCTGTSIQHVQTICDALHKGMAEKYDLKPLRTEGYREARWALLDYGSLVVHVFQPDDRDFYNLERLWGSAGYIELNNQELDNLE